MKSIIKFIIPAAAALMLAAPVRADILYVSEYGFHSIVRYPSGGGGSTFGNSAGRLSEPQGIAFDSVGNLYAAHFGTIEKLTPGGVGSVFASTGSYDPQGIAFDSAGNLYAANSGPVPYTIFKFTPGGVRSVFVSSGLNNPYGLAFDSAGNLYVAIYVYKTI